MTSSRMRPIRSAGLALLLTCGFFLLTAGPALAAGSELAAGPALAAGSSSDVDRTIKDSRITESSGLAPSLLHPGVLWTHNDSGNPPLLFAIGSSGSTVATLRVRGEPALDWEAITSFRGRPGGIAAGAALIGVGDIGDNNAAHSTVRIAIVREPDRLRSGSVRPIRVLRLRYPGGPRDAETLLSDPSTGQLYVVSKSLFSSALYSVPLSVWPGGGGGTSKLTTMTRVASMAANFVTDGTFLPDGRILLRGYGEVWVIDRPADVHDGSLRTLASATLPGQDQGESIAVLNGGSEAVIGSEGRREPVLRIAVPAVAGADGAAGAAGQDTTRPEPTVTLPTASTHLPQSNGRAPAGPLAADPPRFTGIGNLRVWVAVIGGALLVIVISSAALLFRRN